MGKYGKAKSHASSHPAVTLSAELTLPLEDIYPREQDTRVPNDDHVQSLAESIAAVGLIQPLAVDNQGRLLAGAHRLAAIKQLKVNNSDSYNKWFSKGVPIRQYDFDATDDVDRALVIEASENEKRRDYTKTEVKQLAERLKAAGYHASKGQPRTGNKALIPALETIVGKSRRQIQRYLNEEPDKSNAPYDTLLREYGATKKVLKRLLNCDNLPDRIAELAGALKDELEALDRE
jgi:ParB family chromosome partitioning protein